VTLTSYGKNSVFFNVRIGGTFTDWCACKGLVAFEMEACCTLPSYIDK